MHTENPNRVHTNPNTELKEAIDLVYWTLVDAIEMNPDMSKEIEDSWKVILERVS